MGFSNRATKVPVVKGLQIQTTYIPLHALVLSLLLSHLFHSSLYRKHLPMFFRHVLLAIASAPTGSLAFASKHAHLDHRLPSDVERALSIAKSGHSR